MRQKDYVFPLLYWSEMLRAHNFEGHWYYIQAQPYLQFKYLYLDIDNLCFMPRQVKQWIKGLFYNHQINFI